MVLVHLEDQVAEVLEEVQMVMVLLEQLTQVAVAEVLEKIVVVILMGVLVVQE